ASKFLQDRCYSNRAWAKLSGLPLREISSCERAFGDALEWRLWVGKAAFGFATNTGLSPILEWQNRPASVNFPLTTERKCFSSVGAVHQTLQLCLYVL
ncbi:hypothetical protein DFH11DRAFT_1517899, partial [Phellopilus nigrolimitatus]